MSSHSARHEVEAGRDHIKIFAHADDVGVGIIGKNYGVCVAHIFYLAAVCKEADGVAPSAVLSVYYFVPKSLSPASPKPGRM